MSGITTYLENKWLNHSVGKTAFTMPTVSVGLSSTTPATDGTSVTEPSSGSYARITTAGSDWNAASGGVITNAVDLVFPTATADWVSGANLTYGVLYDASTAGNLLRFSALAVAKPVLNGDTFKILAGNLSITIS